MKRCIHSLNLLPHVVPLKPSAQAHVQFSALSVPPFTQLRGQPESRKKQERLHGWLHGKDDRLLISGIEVDCQNMTRRYVHITTSLMKPRLIYSQRLAFGNQQQ